MELAELKTFGLIFLEVWGVIAFILVMDCYFTMKTLVNTLNKKLIKEKNTMDEYTIIVNYGDGSEKDYELYDEADAREFFNETCSHIDDGLLDNEDGVGAVSVELYHDETKIDEYLGG